MVKLVKLLNKWADGRKCALKVPTMETYYELCNITMGVQETTINSEVVKILDYCGIKYKAEGIGWRII